MVDYSAWGVVCVYAYVCVCVCALCVHVWAFVFLCVWYSVRDNNTLMGVSRWWKSYSNVLQQYYILKDAHHAPLSTVATLWLFDGVSGHYSGHSVGTHQVPLCAPIEGLLPGWSNFGSAWSWGSSFKVFSLAVPFTRSPSPSLLSFISPILPEKHTSSHTLKGNMCVHVYVCVSVCVPVCVHVCLCVSVCVYMCVHVCVIYYYACHLRYELGRK